MQFDMIVKFDWNELVLQDILRGTIYCATVVSIRNQKLTGDICSLTSYCSLITA